MGFNFRIKIRYFPKKKEKKCGNFPLFKKRGTGPLVQNFNTFFEGFPNVFCFVHDDKRSSGF